MSMVVILISLLFIGFFSGIEIAFVSANKLRVELLKEKGSTRAKIISNFNHHPAIFINTMLIGLNIALVVFSAVTAEMLIPEKFNLPHLNEFPLLIVQTLITTFIVLIFGELIPKLLFRVNSDQTLLLFAIPVFIFYQLLRPLVSFFHFVSKFIIKHILRSNYVETRQKFTEADLEYLVKETAAATDTGDDETDELNSEIFEKALYLKEVKVRNCMVPRTEVQSIDVDESMDELKKIFRETHHSRIVVYDGNMDTVLGYVHHLDLLKNPRTIRSAIRQMPVVPASMNAQEVLTQFMRERRNMAHVVDEYGGTAGIITLEDLMEQIFGEIEDEHDVEELTEKRVSDTEFIFSGRLDVNYLNEEYLLNIPDAEGEYTTLSGYILSRYEDIPDTGQEIEVDHFKIRVITATDKRIDLVNLRITKTEND